MLVGTNGLDKAVERHTRLSTLENGRPLSRANAQACREAEARKPKVAAVYMKRRMQVMTVAPASDWVPL